MKNFRISRISEPENSAWRIFRSRNSIQIDPDYQRSSDIWTVEKKQLLIDTIINGFDVPKLYFHRFRNLLTIGDRNYEYAIIDGKQRLEAIWNFIEGRFALSADFECLWDDSLLAAGMTYAELSSNFPDLRNAIDSYALTVVCIETDDIEIIEDMFSRLNEAVPLSAAEKRNARGGPVPVAIKSLVNNKFYKEKVPFSNSRYRHFDLAVKFLLSVEKDRVVDTKKKTLDSYVMDWATVDSRSKELPCYERTNEILSLMSDVFIDADPLLKQVGSVILYFHVFRIAIQHNWIADLERQVFLNFEKKRLGNRMAIEQGEPGINDLLEFDRHAQSTNDAYAVKFRVQVFFKFALNIDISLDDL